MSGNRVLYGQKLTDRERRVVALVAHGFTNHDIGARLGLTYDTIKTYVTWINRKLGARNRAHAVTIAAVRGYINLQAKEYLMAPCESSGCFTAEDASTGFVFIRGLDHEFIAGGYAVDTAESWRVFRDDIKAGKYDHIGEAS